MPDERVCIGCDFLLEPDEEVCQGCNLCPVCCDCDDEDRFDRDELGLDPEEDY